MDVLRGLRLNCILAPLLVAVVAAGVLVIQHCLLTRHLSALAVQGGREAIAGVAVRGQMDGLTAAHLAGVWTALAIVRSEADGFIIATQVGATTAWRAGDPRPELFDVVQGPVAWCDGDRLCAAVRLPSPAGAAPRLLYGERPWPAMPGILGLLPWLAGLLGVGALLAWYLAARIWRPVEYLAAAARAALEDRPAPADESDSAETVELRSSVVQLAERYRARGSSAATPPPPPP